ncbi:MAG TPA: isoaspartyl peptidase/L-asparaginase [Candidatus Hodarchaeales archaeon]|nr:isoaspartyl peptidase/L-asparaginase [Candidatus Hodarchaeales archaeon]
MNRNFTIAGTSNASEGLKTGSKMLSEGGSAIDAVEAAIRVVEEDPADWTVGVNGFPNLLGQVELDAGIMIGSSRRAGAVGAVKNFSCPISIARKVMEVTPHVLLVGEGAEKFAKGLGFKKTALLTDEMKKRWEMAIRGETILMPGDETAPKLLRYIERFDVNFRELLSEFDYKTWIEKLSEEYHGTVNVIARDNAGEIVVGVSTSGLALKLPGRLGDSPLPGAGFYATKKGAAACVGTGELAMRLSLARMAVDEITNGKELGLVAEDAIREVIGIKSEYGTLQILLMNDRGEVSAATCASAGKKLYYWVATQDDQVDQPRKILTPIVK